MYSNEFIIYFSFEIYFEYPHNIILPISIIYFFQNYLNKDNRKSRCPTEPNGIEVEIGKNISANIEKTPLPIDFTKEILCNRLNVLPIAPKPTLVDKVDVSIQKTEEATVLLATNVYTIINASFGDQIVPLQVQTSTVNSTLTPICTPNATDTKIDNKIDSNNHNTYNNKSNINPDHCKCCQMLRKIIKRQTFITDYFKSSTNKKKFCDCTNKKYPKISNKLKILINNFKRLSNVVYDDIVNKIEECKTDFRYNKEQDGSTVKDFGNYIKIINILQYKTNR